MIKLDQITHTNYKGKVTYVLPGGEAPIPFINVQ